MLLQIQFGVLLSALSFSPTANLPAVDESDPRIQPDIYRHLREANRYAKMGKWELSLAHSEAVLCLDKIGYTIEFDGLPEKEQARCRAALLEACRIWEKSLSGQTLFVESDDAPIVKVHFQDSVNSNGRDVGGHVKWLRKIEKLPDGQYKMKLAAEIWIRTRQPNNKPMSHDQLLHVAAHEVGHVLGLKDSCVLGELMGALILEEPVARPSAAELASIFKIRDQALELRRASLITALLELEGYNQR